MSNGGAAADVLPHDHGHRLAALTGVRAFAALWVVAYHYQANLYGWLPITKDLAPLLHSGYMGVDLFFCLSGFILAYNYLHRFGGGLTAGDYGRFLWLRLARVYPVQFFTLNLFVLMLVAGKAVGQTVDSTGLRTGPWAYVENLFLVQVWFNEGLSFNGPAWSVSAEWFAYLLFPLTAWLLVRFRTPSVCVVAALACYAALLAVWLPHLDTASATSYALPRVGLEFLAGCFLFMLWERLRGHGTAMWAWGTYAALVAIVGGAWMIGAVGYRGVILAPLFGALILALAGGRGVISGALATRAAVFGGEVSYALYMTHTLVQPVVNHLAPVDAYATASLPARMFLLASVAALIAAAALATHLLVERPARRFLRNRIEPRPTGAARQATGVV